MRIISIEGIDGCGKSTLINNLKNILINLDFKVEISYEPNNFFGKFAKYGHEELNKKDTTYLWWLARRSEYFYYESKSFDFILKDRYYDSTWVYQNLEGTSLEEHNFDEKYFIKPYHTILLDISPELALKRLCEKNEKFKDLYESDTIEIYQTRRQKFLDITEKHKNFRTFSIIEVDNLTPDEIAGISINHILRKIDNHLQFQDEDFE